MHACVIGAGVVGLTSAYYLARRGHSVTVLERGSRAGAETSYANGGQLSYNYVAPLADGSVLHKLSGWLVDRNAPLRFVPRLDPHQWRWCLAFLRHCTDAHARRTLRKMLPLAFHSRDAMAELRQRHPLAFDHRHSGKLVFFRNGKAFDSACDQMRFQASLGSRQEACDARRCREIEPALLADELGVVGGIYTPGDDTGDCYRFCQALTALLQGPEYAVEFRLNTGVTSLSVDKLRVVSARTSVGNVEADCFVIAAGMGSLDLARSIGISLPLYALNGYSLSLPVTDRHQAPATSVTDADAKMVYARLGDQLRVAGMADLTGAKARPDPRRLELLKRQAHAVFPNGGDYERTIPWAGQRPATPDSRPIVGSTRYCNLWLNVGHGALGFTLACGCGELLARQMDDVNASSGTN